MFSSLIKLTWYLLLALTILSSTISISSNSWIGIWVGMEINLIAFMPMIKTKALESSNSMMIYFLAQSLGSMILLFSILMNSVIMLPPGMVDWVTDSEIMMSLMIKLGGPPFFTWLPKTMATASWKTCLWLMTWQKVAPLTAIYQLTEKTPAISMIALLCVMVGSVGGLNQTSLRTIMGYSSITHMGWMIMLSKFNNKWMIYLIIYSLMMAPLCTFLNSGNLMYLNQINNLTLSSKMMFTTHMMSMGGLPPFIGFYPKWMTIQSSIHNNEFIIITLMCLMSLITLFFYMKLTSTVIMMNSLTYKLHTLKTSNHTMLWITLMLPTMFILI